MKKTEFKKTPKISIDIEYDIKISWWWKYIYVPLIKFACEVAGMQVNEERAGYWAKKSITIETKILKIKRNKNENN